MGRDGGLGGGHGGGHGGGYGRGRESGRGGRRSDTGRARSLRNLLRDRFSGIMSLGTNINNNHGKTASGNTNVYATSTISNHRNAPNRNRNSQSSTSTFDTLTLTQSDFNLLMSIARVLDSGGNVLIKPNDDASLRKVTAFSKSMPTMHLTEPDHAYGAHDFADCVRKCFSVKCRIMSYGWTNRDEQIKSCLLQTSYGIHLNKMNRSAHFDTYTMVH